MGRSSAMVRCVCVSGILLGAAALLHGGEPTGKIETVKPAWQRHLQGEDARVAAKQEKQLERLQAAGQLAEALKVSEALLELRQKVQGADHWQSADARWQVETLRRVIKQGEETRKEHTSIFALAQQADTLERKNRFKEAQLVRERILTLYRKVLGEEHPHTALSYANLASNLDNQGKYQEAEESYRKALTICCKVLGEEHPSTALSYSNLASSLKHQGKYKEAEEGYRKALAIQRKILGEDHTGTATSYNNLAGNEDAQGKYKEAEEGYRKALAIQRKILGEYHPHTATSYHNLALNQNAQGKYKEAEEGYHKALTIKRMVLGEEHPSTAITYAGLALTQNAQGKYSEAEKGLHKALTILRKVLGEEHPETAISYSNLAGNQHAQGKYKEAEEGYRKALTIKRKVLGEEHPSTALSYNNLSHSQHTQGKYSEAEESLRKALAIKRKILGEEHPSTALNYHNLAVNQDAQGKYVQAEEGHRKALAIFRKVLGEEHPHTALSYADLASNLDAQGKYVQAEEGYRKALTICRKALGEEHPSTALSYNYLAVNQNAQGKYRMAEEGYREALAIRRKVLGKEHPDTAQSFSNLAHNQNAQGKYAEAESLWRSAADSFVKTRLQLASTGLERATKTSERSPLPNLAAVLARNGKAEEAWRRFEESLSRGTLDDLTTRLRLSPDERAKQTQLAARIDRLNKLLQSLASSRRPTPAQSKRREDLLTQLRQSQDEMAEFARQLEKAYGPAAGAVLPRDKIQGALPPDSALIGWIDLPGQAKAVDPSGEHWAILLRSSGAPLWLRLKGSGDKNAWTDTDTQLPQQLRTALQSSAGQWQSLAERLRKQRLEPLLPHLKGIRHLIVLPSTALAGVPIEVIARDYTISYAHSGSLYAHLRQQKPVTGKGLLALADPVFKTAAEKSKPQPLPPGGVLLTAVLPGSNAARARLRPNDVLLRYGDQELASPADLLKTLASITGDRPIPVVVWREGKKLSRPLDVMPGKLGVILAREPAPRALAERQRMDRLLASRSGDEGKWNRLPGTRVEAAALQRLFGSDVSRLLLDSDSSEQRLDKLAASGELGKYRYLHLATHGEVDNTAPLRSAVILSRDRLPDDRQRTDLLLSGQSIPDGRLTAEEVLRRWQLNAELVTLSACQTALGKYEQGEGFVGFAQALVLSGSRSVCLSLWKVDDTATALLMERFYQNLLGKREELKGPMGKAAALAEAKAWLRQLPREEAVKRAAVLGEGVARGKGRRELPPLPVVPKATTQEKSDCPFAHPYYWAAFVLIGDSR